MQICHIFPGSINELIFQLLIQVSVTAGIGQPTYLLLHVDLLWSTEGNKPSSVSWVSILVLFRRVQLTMPGTVGKYLGFSVKRA